MKQLLLAGTAVLGLTASDLSARADPIHFTYSGSLVDFTVPVTGSFVVGTGNTPLVIAGGAGGGGATAFGRLPGQGGLTDMDGGAGGSAGGNNSLVGASHNKECIRGGTSE